MSGVDSPIRVWGRTNSVNVQKVLWCLAELGLTFEQIDAGLEFGQNNEEWFLAMNPNGKVPLLEHGEFTLWESNSIVRYLCAAYDHGGLYPAPPARRALAECWMDWQLSTIARPHAIAFWNLVRMPESARNMRAVECAVDETNAALAILDAHLRANDYVAGQAFTMGDIPVGAVVHRWLALEGIERPAWPALGRWFERLTARAAFRDHVMLPLS
jgi:glutathione S-transferase